MNYLYVIHIPIIFDNGHYLMPRSATIDLMAHRQLLPHTIKLTLAAPLAKREELKNNNEPFDPIPNIDIVRLCLVDSFITGLVSLLKNRSILNSAIESADFVHTGCGGFPFFFSPCYLAHNIALNKNKPVLFVMDCDLVGKLETEQIEKTSNPIKKSIWINYTKQCWKLYTECLSSATVTFLLGNGVVSRYGKFSNNPLEIYQPIIGSEWIINDKELNSKIETIKNRAIFKLCFAGRLTPEKGVDVMIKALAILKKRGVKVETNIYGEGTHEAEYEHLQKELGLEREVTFHGYKEWGEDLFTELRKNHIQIVPHLTLEMTRNVFDGMASGCALVVSNTKALTKLIRDSCAGCSFTNGDHIALAKTISDLINDRKLLTQYINNGIKFTKNNHRDAHIQKRLNFLYENVTVFKKISA